MGFVVVKVELGQVSTECPTLIIYYLGLVTGQIVADIPSGLSFTALQETKKINMMYVCCMKFLVSPHGLMSPIFLLLLLTATALTALKREY
jgi:hypothetical protein